jgi:hypothetical protein
MTTNKIMALADAYAYAYAYANAGGRRCGQQRFALEDAITRIIAERDTLAAAVEEYHCRLPVHRNEAVMKAALEVTRRLKAASEPAKPGGDHGGKPSPLAAKMATMQEEVGGVLKHGGMSHTGELVAAIHAVARVVEELAKEAKQ